jgi:hypothetical protein
MTTATPTVLTARTSAHRWDADLAAAYAAGVAAANAIEVVPMTVVGRDRTYWVEGGVCGFARVEVRPRNTAFARWLVQYAGWMSSDYHKCVYMNISDYGQSMERKEVFAQAFADRLTRLGHERVTYTSTID